MINFLPPEAVSVVKREYRIRMVSVWALLLAVVALAGAMLLLPTYVLLIRQFDALSLEVVRTEHGAGTQTYDSARTALEKAQTLALQLDATHTGSAASEVLRRIREAQPSAITISSFSYEHTGTTTEKVEVRGSAATRETLAEFSTALERNPLFVRAPVPVSDLAQDRDLPFTLTITLAKSSN